MSKTTTEEMDIEVHHAYQDILDFLKGKLTAHDLTIFDEKLMHLIAVRKRVIDATGLIPALSNSTVPRVLKLPTQPVPLQSSFAVPIESEDQPSEPKE